MNVVLMNILSGAIAVAAVTLNHFGILPADLETFILGLVGYHLTASAVQTQISSVVSNLPVNSSSSVSTSVSDGKDTTTNTTQVSSKNSPL